jgi:hypothetical protein
MKAKKAIKSSSKQQSSKSAAVLAPASSAVQRGASELVAAAEAATAAADPSTAAAHLRAALSQSPEDPAILEALGVALIALDLADEAKSLLERSAALAPDASASKWMYLGQLSFGMDAVRAFEQGLRVLQAEASGAARDRSVSDAYCAIAELFMTDLCDEDEAEARCDAAAAAARGADAGNAEAWARSASLRLCQKRPEEASAFMARAVGILRARDAAAEAAGGGEEGEAAAAAAAADFSRDFRLDTARTCMEMARYDDAAYLLDGLLGEDDTDMETWFLAAEAALLAGDAETAADLAGTADAMLGAALAARGGKKATSGAAAAAAAVPGFGGAHAAARAAAAAASAAAAVDFSHEAIDALLRLPVRELAEQQAMLRALLAKAREALAAAPAGSGVGRGAAAPDDGDGSGGGDDDDDAMQ